jgi:hypothetical protein
MKTYWSGVLELAILDLDNKHEVSGQLHAPAARIRGTHWVGGWMGPRAGLDAVEKRKIPSPGRESNLPRSPHTDSAIPALI